MHTFLILQTVTSDTGGRIFAQLGINLLFDGELHHMKVVYQDAV